MSGNRKATVTLHIVSIGCQTFAVAQGRRTAVLASCATAGDPRMDRKPGERRVRAL